MNANIKKMQIFYKVKCDPNGKFYFYGMDRFCDFLSFRPFDLITTLTYILMDNICPCFEYMVT